jgi:PAS domain S-box-containing protein
MLFCLWSVVPLALSHNSILQLSKNAAIICEIHALVDGCMAERRMRNQPATASVEPRGHNISDGRNIIPADRGHAGQDIFFAAVQMSRLAMVLTDPHQPDNPIIFANQAFEILTGYEQSEILGRNCRFLQGRATNPDTVNQIRQHLTDQADVHEDILNYRKDGTVFWNALFISPVFDPSGQLLYFVASQLDVTKRREAEAVLQQAQRLESLGAMASSVAHEFNNLMLIVFGSLGQLEQDLAIDQAQRIKLDRAHWAIGQAGRLTQQMLSFARRQFQDGQLRDVNEVIGNFDAILRQMAGKNVALTLQLADDPMMAMLDASQFEMALLNLVRNAADAMPDGGPLMIQTRAGAPSEGAVEGTVEVTVQDAGTGMLPDVMQRATEPFFTTKPLGAGTGLGLSMVKGFVEQSGGRMLIASQPNEGTSITLRFPALPS